MNPASHGNPDWAHSRRVAISESLKPVPSGGIRTSLSFDVTRARSSLDDLSADRISEPDSPPARSVSRVFKEKPPFFWSPAWHSTQCFFRMGTTRWAKSMGSWPGQVVAISQRTSSPKGGMRREESQRVGSIVCIVRLGTDGRSIPRWLEGMKVHTKYSRNHRRKITKKSSD